MQIIVKLFFVKRKSINILIAGGAFRTQSNILDKSFYKNSKKLKTVIYFRKKPHVSCLTFFLTHLW